MGGWYVRGVGDPAGLFCYIRFLLRKWEFFSALIIIKCIHQFYVALAGKYS